jgi:hypothetical protein
MQETQQGYVDLPDDEPQAVIACSAGFVLEKRAYQGIVVVVALSNPCLGGSTTETIKNSLVQLSTSSS